MKYIKFLLIGLVFISCNQNNPTTVTEEEQIEILQEDEVSKDEVEVRDLIRQVLKWADSKDRVSLLPALADEEDEIYIGFDMNEHKKNLDKLKKTNFFAAEFIENYNQIILTLDKKIQNKELEEWFVDDLPPFNFMNNANPWCLCQDVPYDEPNPWDFVEINIIRLNNENGDLEWKWGGLDINTDQSWKRFKYKFRVTKENNKWKISYMEGFNFKNAIEAW